MAACGGPNAAPQAADLKGDSAKPERSFAAVTNLDDAPTQAHRALAQLLPGQHLRQESVTYSDWDQSSALPFGDDPKKAALPTVKADYRADAYGAVTGEASARGAGKQAKLDYPQDCTLVLVKAPQPAATDAIAQRLREHFAEKGFTAQDPVKLNDGTKDGVLFERYLRIDASETADKVYMAYMRVMGDVVAYAVESEQPPPIKTSEGTQAKRVLTGQLGSRLGAQVLVQVNDRAGR